jgi:hypothetical protein
MLGNLPSKQLHEEHLGEQGSVKKQLKVFYKVN